MAVIHHLCAIVLMMYESNASLQDYQQKYPRGCHALEVGGEKNNLYKCEKEISYLWESKRRELRREGE